MKKCVVLLILLTLSLGLCACGGGTEDIELPTEVTENATTDQSAESQNPTGETYPWETEFNEEDYIKHELTAPNGDKITTWREGTISGREARQIYEWTDGTIEDSYYYPSGNKSHSYTWGADGSYSEFYFLDNGYYDADNRIVHTGTVIYEKTITADGTEIIMNCDENGAISFSSTKEADGTYSEYSYFPNGNPSKNIYDNPNTGEHSECEYYENGNTRRTFYSNTSTGEYYENESFENGNPSKSISHNPNTGEHSEFEYFENGNLKYTKAQSREYTIEEHYDEEGFRTYYYYKDAKYEIELIADETGKLIKFTQNGKVYENEDIPGHIAGDYNFRG